MNRIAVIVASVWLVVAFSVAGVGSVGAASTGSAGGQSATVADGGIVLAQTDNTTEENTTTTTETTGNETTGNETTGNETTGNETEALDDSETENGSIGPGAQLAGVIGVQQAELNGEIEHRAFGLSIAAARSNGSKAQVVSSNTEELRERIQDLENRTAALNESYQNGSISTGTYHARLAHLSAQIRMTERLVNQTADTAAALPEEARRAHGVNVTHLEKLKSDARNMSGPEIAAVAKQIGGPQVGHPLGKERGPPEGVPGHGPSDERGGQGGPGQMGPQSQNNTTVGPMNNSTMGPNGGAGPDGNSTERGNGGGQSGPAAIGDVLTFVRSLFAAPW